MKRITAHSSLIRWTGLLGLTTLFAGATSMLPAHADDYARDNRIRDHIRRDIADTRRDQDHLRDLYRRRDWLAGRRDWKAVHRLDDEISRLRRNIDRDRQEVRQDAQRLHRDQYRYGSNAGYNNGYRNSQGNYRGHDDYGRSDYRMR